MSEPTVNLTDIHPRAAEVLELAKTGATWRSIAEKTGMTEGGVYLVVRALRDAGLLQHRATNKARGAANRAEANDRKKALLKCLSCLEPFQSMDRRTNRICARCKANAA